MHKEQYRKKMEITQHYKTFTAIERHLARIETLIECASCDSQVTVREYNDLRDFYFRQEYKLQQMYQQARNKREEQKRNGYVVN